MSFKSFQNLSSRAPLATPRLRIHKTGYFDLNRSAMTLMEEKNIHYVALLFDLDQMSIGLKPVEPKHLNAYRIRPNKGMGKITATAFLKHFGIEHKKESRSYPLTWNDELNIAEIKL